MPLAWEDVAKLQVFDLKNIISQLCSSSIVFYNKVAHELGRQALSPALHTKSIRIRGHLNTKNKTVMYEKKMYGNVLLQYGHVDYNSFLILRLKHDSVQNL